MIYGILGLGSIGSRHAANLKVLGKEVVAFDPSSERRQRAGDAGIAASASRDEVLNKSTAVIIASPNDCHLRDMRDALAAGHHCFVEKPLAHVADGVKELLDEAAAKGCRVFAGLNLRFHPAVTAAKSWLEEGALGRPLWAIFQSCHYLPDWRPAQDYRTGYAADPATGGVLFDIIHEFDLAHHLLGPAETVAAAARNTGTLDIPSEDCADVILGHAAGVRSVLHLDYVTRPMRRVAEIGGERGILRLDLVRRDVTLTDADGFTSRHRVFADTTPNDDYVTEMTAFIACVEQDALPACDGHEALAVLRQVIAARHQCGLPGS